MYYSANSQLVRVIKVEKSEGPKLINDAIEEWPNYIRLVLPILNIPIDKKRKKSESRLSPVHKSSPVIVYTRTFIQLVR